MLIGRIKALIINFHKLSDEIKGDRCTILEAVKLNSYIWRWIEDSYFMEKVRMLDDPQAIAQASFFGVTEKVASTDSNDQSVVSGREPP